MDIYGVCEKVGKYLSDNGLICDVYPYRGDMPVVDVDIHWGDWKHDHLRAKWIMEEKGAICLGDVVTEENGSDCYSAVHHFVVDAERFEEDVA